MENTDERILLIYFKLYINFLIFNWCLRKTWSTALALDFPIAF